MNRLLRIMAIALLLAFVATHVVKCYATNLRTEIQAVQDAY